MGLKREHDRSQRVQSYSNAIPVYEVVLVPATVCSSLIFLCWRVVIAASLLANHASIGRMYLMLFRVLT